MSFSPKINQRLHIARLTSFCVVAYAFTWILLPIAAHSIPVSLIALFGPAVAALLLTAIDDREERQRFVNRLLHWRSSLHWFLLALLLPLPISALRSFLEYACGAHGDLRFQEMTGISLIVFVLVVGEEIGWRGYALPKLLQHWSPWAASTMVGTLWAFWHLPLFYIDTMPQYGTPVIAFTIYTISLSVILTHLVSHNQGSVLLATLFHGSVNTLGFVNTAASPTLRGWSNALCYGLVAISIVVWTWQFKSKSQHASTTESPSTFR